jgi:hypothetical protein
MIDYILDSIITKVIVILAMVAVSAYFWGHNVGRTLAVVGFFMAVGVAVLTYLKVPPSQW